MTSIREQLASYTPKVLEVPMSELGEGTVFYVRQLLALDQLRWSASVRTAAEVAGEGDPMTDQIAALLELTLCESDGARVFAEGEFDWSCLGQMPWDLVQRLYTASMEVNGMRPDDQASAEGNSGLTEPGALRIA